MRVIPHKYQRQAIDFVVNRLFVKDELGAGLFLDPGLGKTLITLVVLRMLIDFGMIKNALVIAPLRVCKLVWEQENDKWAAGFTMNMLCQRVKRGLKDPVADIELVNPESLHLLQDHCHRWTMVVVDESTKFKNWTSKRTKALRKMLPNFTKRLILTGTPAPNSLADLHSQVFILDDGAALGRNVTVFRSLYMYNTGWQGRKWEVKEDLKDRIETQVAPLCLRLDAESCLDMPELVTNNVLCELPEKHLHIYRRLQRELVAQLESGDVLAQNAASAYNKMRQFANGNMYDEDRTVHWVHDEKLNALDDLFQELSGKPLLVFYQFQHDFPGFQRKFKDKCKVLNGQTKAKDAQKLLEQWNNGDIPVFACQEKAASHGLNMQGCGTDVSYYGMSDSFEDYDQSYRRVYRQGVKGTQVRIHRLLMDRTVDILVRDRVDMKDQTQKQFLEKLKAHAMEGL